MTSPSRRKRQTTRPSSRPTNSADTGSRPIARSLLVLAITVAVSTAAANADELKWRSGRAFKTLQPAAARHRADAAVRPAAFGESDVQPAEGRVHFRSLMLRPDEPAGVVRSAQLPSSEADAERSGTQNEFGPMPDDLPPLDAPEGLEFDMPPQPEDSTLQLDQNQRQPLNRQPAQPPVAPRVDSLDVVPDGPLPPHGPTPGVGTMEAEREKSHAACEQGLSDLEAKTIDTLSLTIAVTGSEGSDYPFECSLDENRWHDGRCWDQTTYLWKASALCHKPLFFEDEHLERYGHSWSPCCQPLISGAHFFTRLPILPYCMGVEPPNECIYALGHYRPGSCAPYMCNPVPLSARGALFQAGAVVGAAAALP